MTRVPSVAEIKAMVAAGAAESMSLEFKAAPWERNDQGKRECLKDITALANTRGGVVIVGVTEKNNAATGFAPLPAADAEAERSRINDLVHAGVEPRVYGVNIEAIPVDDGVVLVIGVPRSSSRPHRVTTQSLNRIFMRNSTGVYEANVADLRNLFLQGAEIRDRAMRWHEERRIDLHTGDVVANIATAANSLVLHLIPADAFTAPAVVDLSAAASMGQRFWPIGAAGFNNRFSFEGYLNYRSNDPCHGYTLVQRNGIVEAVKIGLFDSANGIINARATENALVKCTYAYVTALVELGVTPPIYALVTIEGTRGAYIPSGDWGESGAPINRDNLALSVAVIEGVNTVAEVGAAYRAAFDSLWNAGGFVGSSQFNDGGAWTGRAD